MTLKFGSRGPEVLALQKRLNAQGFFVTENGSFDADTDATVRLFQTVHVGPNRAPLLVDGEVGGKTLWALDNPSGDAQRSYRAFPRVGGLKAERVQLLGALALEHSRGVCEVPDGSNRGPDVDRYFAGTGIIGQPWCCAFVTYHLQPFGKFTRTLGVHTLWAESKFGRPDTRSFGGSRVSAPKPGDVFVQLFEAGKGHTGFVIGLTPDGKSAYTCEGNAGNRVKVGLRHLADIDGVIDFLQDGQSLDFERTADMPTDRIDGRTR